MTCYLCGKELPMGKSSMPFYYCPKCIEHNKQDIENHKAILRAEMRSSSKLEAENTELKNALREIVHIAQSLLESKNVI